MFVHSHHTLIVLLYDEKEKERKQYFSKIQYIFTQNGLSITSLNLHHHKICIKMADELFNSRIL